MAVFLTRHPLKLAAHDRLHRRYPRTPVCEALAATYGLTAALLLEITSAFAEFDGELREVIDTPGTNTLAPQSYEERVTRDLLLDVRNADVVQVGDLGNLRRTFLLSLQLAEHEVPFTLCLNMSDEPHAQSVDIALLEELLGVPVVATSALRRWNIEKLKRRAVRPGRPRLRLTYSPAVEARIALNVGSRAAALAAICSGDEDCAALAGEIATARLRVVDDMIANVTTGERIARGRDRLGALCMHRIWGWPILALVLYAAWLLVGKLGAGTLVDFFELLTIFLVGYLAAKVVRGESGDFIIEIPPMRVPRASNPAR